MHRLSFLIAFIQLTLEVTQHLVNYCKMCQKRQSTETIWLSGHLIPYVPFSTKLLYSDYEIPLQYTSAELCHHPTVDHFLVTCFLNQMLADVHQSCRQDQKNHGYVADIEPCKTFH